MTCNTCSECTYLNLNKEYESGDGRFWCERKLEWHFANDHACYREIYCYDRSESTAKSYKEHSERCQNSGGTCLLSTISEILGLKDNNFYLNTLRNFRENELQCNEKYRELLVNYDIIGPIITENLRKLPKKQIIAKNLYELGIKKMVQFINKNEYLKAIQLYNDMMGLLIEGLNITAKPTIDQINNADINKSGHGVYVKTA